MIQRLRGTRPRCATCGRDLGGVADPWRAGKLWFCSEEHFQDDYVDQRRRDRRARRATFLAPGLLIAALAIGFAVQAHRQAGSAGTLSDRNPLVRAELQLVQESRHARHVHVRLDAAAAAVAGAYVRAEYVSHDCARLETFGRAPSGSTIAVQRALPCTVALHHERAAGLHLVAGSRKLEHGCDPLIGVAIVADECFQYTLVTREADAHGDSCGRNLVRLYVDREHGRWTILGEGTTSESASTCRAADLRRWARRVPWQPA